MAAFKELPADKFTEKLCTVFNNAGLSMALAIGNSVGLFDAMAKLEKPATSQEISLEAGLVERSAFIVFLFVWKPAASLFVNNRLLIKKLSYSLFHVVKME